MDDATLPTSPRLRAFLKRHANRERPPDLGAIDGWAGAALNAWAEVARPIEERFGGLLISLPSHRLRFGPAWIASLGEELRADAPWPRVSDEALGELLVVGVSDREEGYAIDRAGAVHRWHDAFEEVLDPVAASAALLFEKLAVLAAWRPSGSSVRIEGSAPAEAFTAVGASRVAESSDAVSSHYEGPDALYVAFHRPLGRPPQVTVFAHEPAAARTAALALRRAARGSLRS